MMWPMESQVLSWSYIQKFSISILNIKILRNEQTSIMEMMIIKNKRGKEENQGGEKASREKKKEKEQKKREMGW